MPESSDVPSYSLNNLSPTATPNDFQQLERWLTCNGTQRSWDGKIYVARTIYWNPDRHEFLQTGCSPNYHAGWWSLACCKHDMREARPFREEVSDFSIPTYVFTLASRERELGQALVSVAMVTNHSFNTMEEYAQFLLTTGNRALISSRLTRERQDDGLFGWRFGDCHANMAAEVGEPNSHHVHYPNNWSKADRDGKHLILVSNRFLLWSQPVFVAARTQKQSRYGKDITSANLRQLLRLL